MPLLRRPLVAVLTASVLGSTLALLAPLTSVLAGPAAAAEPPTIRFNEVESNGDPVGDWAELVNTGTAPVDLSGLKFKDGDDTHAFYSIPDGTTLTAGGFFVLTEAQFGFGLGGADSVRLVESDGTTPVDSYAWTAHATTSYGRCPDGTGSWKTTTATTQGAANDCSSPVRINEVESSGGTPGDWIELYNPSAGPLDLSGFVLRDNGDGAGFVLPAGTTLAAGAFAAYDVDVTGGFGLGGGDSARLFAPDGVTLVDSYTWTAHAATTYGRCPDGTGAFTATSAPTKAAANACPGDLTTSPWPGGAEVSTVDVEAALGGDVSGLAYEGSGSTTPGVLWAVNNGGGALQRLVRSGSTWGSDPTGGWGAGKALHYLDGTGIPDAEGVTLVGGRSAGGIYVATERNNAANSVSRPAILRFDPSSGASLTATDEWNLTADLPAVAANAGLEGITWVPDTDLTASGFRDDNTGLAYTPTTYVGHGDGLFLVGLEGNGKVYAYALSPGGAFTRVASFASGFPSVMDLQWDTERAGLWAVCDDTCNGRTTILRVEDGAFAVDEAFERPTAMPNLNNEGFATAARSECVNGIKPVFWSDDSATAGHALRAGTIACTPPVDPTVTARLSSSSPKSGGWYRTPVTVRFTCVAGSAALASACPAPVTLTSDGKGQRVTRQVRAVDGGVTTVAVAGINIDRTRPSVRITGVRAGATYHGTGPKVRCKATDKLSGVASCSIRKSRTGKRVTATATARDNAGNVSRVRVTYRLR